jgi:hypothetical protein
MGMEHRWSARNPAGFEAIVKYPPLGWMRAKVRNTSLGGMFIETGPVALNINTPVELLIERQGNPARTPYQLRAMVVRAVPGGAGLMFMRFDDTTSGALPELLIAGDADLGGEIPAETAALPDREATDHRWSSRVPLQIDVAIHNDSRMAPLHFESRDISLGGIFVETGSMVLPLNAFVVLSFTLTAGERIVDYRLPALVVRNTRDGAGLMFQEFDPNTVRSLREMLYSGRITEYLGAHGQAATLLRAS